MSDFYIKGVTILGKVSEQIKPLVVLLFILFMFLAFVCLFYALYHVYEKKGKDISPLIAGVFFFGILSFALYQGIWSDVTYTVSIDDTASYLELVDKFSTIKELANGLYEVTLKCM